MLESSDAGVHSGEGIGVAGVAGVVEVPRRRMPGGDLAHSLEQPPNLGRHADADRVGQGDLHRPPSYASPASRATTSGSTSPSKGQPKAATMVTERGTEPLASATIWCHRPIIPSIGAPWLRRLNVSLATSVPSG